ncbi:MAG: hypothetical protein N4A54_00530 [Peptostreptococcaceae bacterium]|nr:hypothetical protein [Peptostreptococcaceae bacterium]
MSRIESIEKKLLDVNVKLESNGFELRDIEEDVKTIKKMIEEMKEMENTNTQKECILNDKVAEIEVKIGELTKELNIIEENTTKLNEVEKDLDKLQRETNIEYTILKQYADNGLAMYGNNHITIRANIKPGFDKFEIEPKGCRGIEIKKAKMVMSSKDSLVNIKMETLKEGQGWFVTGSYVYDGQTYYGSWYANGSTPIVGKGNDGIIRGAMMHGNSIKTILGMGVNAENCKITEAHIDPKTNKITFRYMNDRNAFYSDIKINGIGI